MDISSLVDVSFLLLIYFLVAASLTQRERDVKMDVPRPSGAVVAEADPVLLSVRGDGAVFYGEPGSGLMLEEAGSPIGLQALKAYLKGSVLAVSADREPVISLRIDDEVDHQRFTSLMATLNELEMRQVAILTD